MRGPGPAPLLVLLLAACAAPGARGIGTPRGLEHVATATARTAPMLVGIPALPVAAPARRSPADVLVDAWCAAATDAERERAAEALVAAGDSALAALLAALAGEDDARRGAAVAVLPRFEERAAAAVAARLRSGALDTAELVAVLPALARFCRSPISGEPLWRALLPHFGDEALAAQPARDALAEMAMSARGLVPELLERWEHGDERTSATACLALMNLRCFSGDAALAVAKHLRTADLRDERCRQAFRIVYWSGRTDAALLPEIVALTHSPEPGVRLRGARLLLAWGPAAAPAVADLVRLLRDENSDVHVTASRALHHVPAAVQEGRDDLVRAILSGAPDDAARGDNPLRVLVGVRARLRRELESLDPALRARVAALLLDSAAAPDLDLLRVVASRGGPELQLLALRYLGAWDGRWSPSERGDARALAVTLLDATDAGVRAAAFRLVASLVRPPPPRLVEQSEARADDPTDPLRGLALVVLAQAQPQDRAVRDAALEYVVGDDPELADAGIRTLALDDHPIAGWREDALAALRDALLHPRGTADDEERVRALLRVEGGEEAAVDAILARVAAARAEGGGVASRMRGARLLPRLRSRLVERMRKLYRSPAQFDAEAAAQMLSECCDEPELLAACAPVTRATLARLLALGDAGRSQLAVLVGRAYPEQFDAVREGLGDSVTDEEILAAAARAQDDARKPPQVGGRRRAAWPVLDARSGAACDTTLDEIAGVGAIRLTRCLAPERAVPLLLRFAREAPLGAAAVQEIVRRGNEVPGSVPPEALAEFVADGAFDADGALYALAAHAGVRDGPLPDALAGVAALRPASPQERKLRLRVMRAAVALHALTGDATALRAALLDGCHDARLGPPDMRAGTELTAETVRIARSVPWSDAERRRVADRFVRAASDVERERWLPLVAALGHDADPLVPELVRLLQRDYEVRNHTDWMVTSMQGMPYARVLVALGDVAAVAQPALRHWRAVTGGEPERD